jgi:hypothetical protein
MNKSYLAMAIAVMCIFGIGVRSRAQEQDGIVVKVPFDFVVAATTMPAGTYRVGRCSDDPHSGLILRGGANSAVVLPMTVEEASIPKALLTFELSEGKYFLGKIETPAGVYRISAARDMPAQARTGNRSTVSVDGAN